MERDYRRNVESEMERDYRRNGVALDRLEIRLLNIVCRKLNSICSILNENLQAILIFIV